MIVGVATFELHIPHAQSLKEKRAVVRSLADRLRKRFDVALAEVGWQDLHQRARFGVAIVSADAGVVERSLQAVQEFVETSGEAMLTGWEQESIHFEQPEQLGVPRFEMREEGESDEEDS